MMTSPQRERAHQLIAMFGEAKREVGSARQRALRGVGSVGIEDKERRLAEVLAEMDELARELWANGLVPVAA